MRDGDRLNLIPSNQLAAYITARTSKQIPTFGTFLTGLAQSGGIQDIQQSIQTATQPLRDKEQQARDTSSALEMANYRSSPQVQLFKVISSFLHREICQQVKQAAIQNGFRCIQENKEPFTARDGTQKLFFCCHHKQNKCLFRLQFMRRQSNEPFRYYKGRDMHNHAFMDPKTLVSEHFKQKVQIMNEHENLAGQLPRSTGVNGGDHNLYQSLQAHFSTIQQQTLEVAASEAVQQLEKYKPTQIENCVSTGLGAAVSNVAPSGAPTEVIVDHFRGGNQQPVKVEDDGVVSQLGFSGE